MRYSSESQKGGARVSGKIENKSKYGTLCEVRKSMLNLGILSRDEYADRFSEDPQLPAPDQLETYAGFIGFTDLCGLSNPEDLMLDAHGKYLHFDSAVRAARRMGPINEQQYWVVAQKDPALVLCPASKYREHWCGWDSFLGVKKNFYPTIRGASAAALQLGICNSIEYTDRYVLDPWLPADPRLFYRRNWRGWRHFLKKEKYRNWKEAQKVALHYLGVKTREEYVKVFFRDPGLPVDPVRHYKEVRSWSHFLDKEKDFYPTWREASAAVQSLSPPIKTWEEYHVRYKEDSRLPSNPDKKYRPFPGWRIFLQTAPIFQNLKKTA